MIKSLKVNKLNQQMSFDLKFHDDINIITGKNGSGKTTLLKLLWYAISGNLVRIIQEINFESFELETDSVRIEMIVESTRRLRFFRLKYRVTGHAEKSTRFSLRTAFVRDEVREANRSISLATGSSVFFPTFRRIEGGFSLSGRSEERNLHNSDLGRMLRVLGARHRHTSGLQQAMLKLSELLSVGEHQFVASTSTDDISRLLTTKYAEVSEKNNKMQMDWLAFIVKQAGEGHSAGQSTDGHTQELLSEIQKRASRVKDVSNALLRPFTVLSELIGKIFQHKGIRTGGPVTLGEAKDAILSDWLSSGEKQMLSFLCYNAFANKSCIFIDEPEISLHVDWQRMLFPVLLEQSTGNQFIVATHSPFIYSKYADKELVLADRGDADADTPDDGTGDPQHPSKNQLAYAPGGG